MILLFLREKAFGENVAGVENPFRIAP